MTIEGSDLNSVAEPHITLTVIVRRFDNDTNTTSSPANSNAQVNDYISHCIIQILFIKTVTILFSVV